MSDTTQGLMIHAKLDNMEGGKVFDSSGNSHEGTVQGNPQIVIDDMFGSVLDFDGNDYVSIPDHADLKITGDLTLEAWFYVDSAPATWAIITVKGETKRNYGIWYNYPDKQFLFQQYGAAGNVTAISNALIELNTWYHIAGVRKGSKAYLYVNGLEVASLTGLTHTPYTSADPLIIGGYSYKGAARYHKGKISDVRLYNRALTQLEIQRDMEDRPTSVARFRMAHPIDFVLTDDNDRHVLYIDDSGQSRNLNFEIVNTSGEAVTIPAGSGTAAADNYHLELRFRPATLSAAAITALKALTAPGTNWNMAYVHNTNGTDSLYFLSTAARTLNSGDKLKITLPGIGAEPGKGARGTRVETRYNNITFRGESLNGYLAEHLSIVNHGGKQYLPLHTGFHLGNRVLNDGNTGNTLLLRLTNTMKPDAAYPDRAKIKLNGANAAAPSKLILSFDAQAAGESKDWALGETGEVSNLIVKVKKESTTGALVEDTAWTVTKTVTGNNAQWSIAPGSGTTIDPGTHITVELSDIVTDLPAGLTNLYLHYENIPGYWDGHLVCPIEKSPMFLNSDKVGIDTTSPSEKLEVNGNIKLGNSAKSLYLKNTRFNDPLIASKQWSTLRISANQAIGFWANNEAENDDNPQVVIDNEGKLGIGTTDPQDKLDVNGALRFNGNADRRVYGASRSNRNTVVVEGHWDELEVKGRVIDWTGGNLHIGYDNDHSSDLVLIGNGKLKAVQLQGSTDLYVGGYAGIGTADPHKNLHITRGDELQPGIHIDGDGIFWDIVVAADSPNDQDLVFGFNGQWESAWVEPMGGIGFASDLKLKENVKPLNNILKKVLKLKPISFTWKDFEAGDRSQVGFGAQDVEKVFPQLVKERKGTKSLKYTDFSVLAIAALQEQQKKIDKLEKTVAELSKKVETLLDQK